MAGEVDVDAMLRRITAKQFRDWAFYDELEPFGADRLSVELAQIAQMIFNMAVAVKDRQPLDKFLIPWGKTPAEIEKGERHVYLTADGEHVITTKPPQSFEEQIMIAKIIAHSVAAGAIED